LTPLLRPLMQLLQKGFLQITHWFWVVCGRVLRKVGMD
jgi:hypothetical protein